LGNWPIDLAPPDIILRCGLLHDEPVVRRAAGVAARLHDQRAEMGDLAFIPPRGLFIEHGCRQVPINSAGVFNAVFFDPVIAYETAKVLHGSNSCRKWKRGLRQSGSPEF